MNVAELIDQIKAKLQMYGGLPTPSVMPIDLDDSEMSKPHKVCPVCRRHFRPTLTVCPNHRQLLVPTNHTEVRLFHPGEKVLDDRFKIEKWVGSGTLHEVYAARDHQNRQTCAVKILNPELGYDQKTVKRYAAAIVKNMTFDHPNIAKTVAHGTRQDRSGERPLSVVEWLPGETLSERLVEPRAVNANLAIKICIAVCKALDYAHDRGVTHQDLRPSNIFLLSDGTVKVTDFGLAERMLRGLDWKQPENRINTGSVYGNADYIDPHYATKGIAGSGSDVYSLGCILYECLTGSPPFVGENQLQVLFGHLQSEAEAVSNKCPELKETGLDEVLKKCLEKDPANRYQSARELQDALAAIKLNTCSP
jgi:serine/threonine-protein kinase